MLTNRGLDMRSFLSDLRFAALPPEVIDKARWCLADLIGTAVAGLATPLAGIVTDHAADFFGAGSRKGAPSCRPMTGGPVMSPAGAALVGGMVIDSVDSHDGHSLTKGHVGCGVLPALVAVAEAQGATLAGNLFMALLVAGYEIGTRVGIALHRSAADYHSSGAWNAVTCAALTAHLLGLDAERFHHALGIAEYHGPRSQMMRNVDHPTMVKDGSGWGAMAGVSAAYLAASRFTGAPAVSVVAEALDDIWGDLGTRWRILEQYTKPYPVCRWAHPGIDAVRELQAAHDFRVSDVEEVFVHTFYEATRLFQGVPETTDQAQYGTSFPTAAALIHGDVLPQHIADDALADPVVRELTGRIHYCEDAEFSRRFPAQRFARVEIRLRDGRNLTSSPREPRGDPACPLSHEEWAKKFRLYTTPAWGESKSERCFRFLEGFGGTATTVGTLLELLRT
jgi:2-methylcitrate dehydratase PrpD